MQIKATIKYHYIIIRLAEIKKTITKFWQGCEVTGTHTAGGNVKLYYNYMGKLLGGFLIC